MVELLEYHFQIYAYIRDTTLDLSTFLNKVIDNRYSLHDSS